MNKSTRLTTATTLSLAVMTAADANAANRDSLVLKEPRANGSQVFKAAEREGRLGGLQDNFRGATLATIESALGNANVQNCREMYGVDGEPVQLGAYEIADPGHLAGVNERPFKPNEMCAEVVIDDTRYGMSLYCGNIVLTPLPVIPPPATRSAPLDVRRPSQTGFGAGYSLNGGSQWIHMGYQHELPTGSHAHNPSSSR